MKRSKGVTFFACVFFFWGVVGLLAALFGIGNLVMAADSSGLRIALSPYNPFLFLSFVFVVSVFSAATAISLWEVLAWSRSAAIVLSLVNILGGVVDIWFRGFASVTGGGVLAIILSVTAVYFFTRSDVIKQFQGEPCDHISG